VVQVFFWAKNYHLVGTYLPGGLLLLLIICSSRLNVIYYDSDLYMIAEEEHDQKTDTQKFK